MALEHFKTCFTEIHASISKSKKIHVINVTLQHKRERRFGRGGGGGG